MYDEGYKINNSNDLPSDGGGSDMAWSGGKDPPLHLSEWEQDSDGVYHLFNESDDEEEAQVTTSA